MIERDLEFEHGAITLLAVDDKRGKAASQLLDQRVVNGPAINLQGKRVLLSYLYPKKIPAAVLERYDVRLNFHPAPLPDYRGFAPYTWGIINKETTWAATCHHMTDEIDAGGIVHMVRFSIHEPETVTAEGLRDQTAPVLLEVFGKVVAEMLAWGRFVAGPPIYTKKLFERTRMLELSEGAVMERYRRAFHCPPFKGFNEV